MWKCLLNLEVAKEKKVFRVSGKLYCSNTVAYIFEKYTDKNSIV